MSPGEVFSADEDNDLITHSERVVFTCYPEFKTTLASIQDVCKEKQCSDEVANVIYETLPVRCRSELIYMKGPRGYKEVTERDPSLDVFCRHADDIISNLMKNSGYDITDQKFLQFDCLEDIDMRCAYALEPMLNRIKQMRVKTLGVSYVTQS